jgi:hypothetical protein
MSDTGSQPDAVRGYSGDISQVEAHVGQIAPHRHGELG